MTAPSVPRSDNRVDFDWGPEDWVKPASCLAKVCGMEGHICGGLDYVKTLAKQQKQLTILFGTS